MIIDTLPSWIVFVVFFIGAATIGKWIGVTAAILLIRYAPNFARWLTDHY